MSSRKLHYSSIEEAKHHYDLRKVTNYRYRMTQMMFTAGDESQFYESCNLPIEKSTINTFKYLFKKIKKGIFVHINDTNYVFLPFTNVYFRNDWSYLIDLPREVDWAAAHRHKWVANNGLVRFETKYIEKESGVSIVADMFDTLFKRRFQNKCVNLEFFINKRDFPVIGKNNTEPYDHIYGDYIPLKDHIYDSHALVLSPVTTEFHDDKLMPNFADWCLASLEEGKYFPDYNYAGDFVDTEFKDKIGRAVFRGSSTGIGVDIETNMRLKVCEMSNARPDLVDAGITFKNTKYRKTKESRLLKRMIVKDEWMKSPMTDNEQIRYKYILIIDGHSAAFRLSRFLRYNCVVFIVLSKYISWIRQFMAPFYHFIPIKEDMSDLYEKIEWCNNNENECLKIIARARNLYDSKINIDFMLDYLENIVTGK